MQIKLAARDWDWLTPLVLGDVRVEGFDLAINRVGTLPDDFANDPRYDAAELSFGKYARERAAGDRSIVGVPTFLMRGFRLRCIIVADASGLTKVSELRGKRIGVTGWPDSGNIWTRALLRRQGIEVDDAFWFAGRLTANHPIADRLAGFGRPGRIEAMPGEEPMMEALAAGRLDAVFTPFMPPGFSDAGSPFRQLVPDFRSAESAYFKEVGYVPGMHVLGLKPAIAAAHPALADALSAALDRSAALWLEKREKYADTTPWILDELQRSARDLSPGWNRNGLAANAGMIADFATELHAQGLTDRRLDIDDLFPEAAAA